MNFLRRLGNAIKRFFTGGGSRSNSGSSNRSSGRSYTPRYTGGSTRSYSGGGGFRPSSQMSLRERLEEDRKKKRQQERQNAYKVKETPKKSTVIETTNRTQDNKTTVAENRKRLLNDRKAFQTATRQSSFNKALKNGTEKQKLALEAQKKRQQERSKREIKRAEFHEATKNKYNTEVGTKEQRARARQRIKSGEWQSDPNVAKYEYTAHPIASTVGRKIASGMSWNASDLATKKLARGEMAEAEKIYEKNVKEHPYAAMGGELLGSLVSFGGVGKGVSKLSGKALATGTGKQVVKRLAGSKAIKTLASRSADKALEKGAVKTAGKALRLADEIADAKARKIVSGLVENTAIDLTAGAINDINRATAQYKAGSDEWWKEIGSNVKWNVALGGGATALNALTKGSATKQALKNIAESDKAKSVLKPLAGATETLPNIKAKRPRVPEVAGINLKGELSEAEKNTLASTRNTLANTLESNPADKDARRILKRNIQRIDKALGDTASDSAQNEAKEVINQADDLASQITKEMDEAHNIARDTTRPQAERNAASERFTVLKEELDKIRDTVDENVEEAVEQTAKEDSSQLSLEDIAEEPKKKTPPKTKAQKAKARADEKLELEELALNQRKGIDRDVRSATKGEYGYRQGEATASTYGSASESERIVNSQKKIREALNRDGAFNSDEFGVFKTANRAKRDEIASNAYNRVSKDPQSVLDRLREIDARLRSELKSKSALESAEHISIDDIADVTALRNLYEESGQKVPDEYEQVFSNIIAWQKTENAQGLVATDLFLKENSPEYRRTLLQRDLTNFMKKVIGADEAGIADIKRSLDANFGEGYFDKALKELSNTKRKWGEAEFREAYKDLQSQIFMNSKPSVWDTVNLFRHSFMLSSLKTGANNIIGNVMMRMMYNVSDLMQVIVENTMKASGADFRRTTALLKSNDQKRLARMFTSGALGESNIKNAKYLEDFDDQAFANVINEWANIDVSEMMESSKYMGDIVKGINYKPTTAGGAIKQGFVKFGGVGNKAVSYMLNEPDSWFVERNYRSALMKYLEANGVRNSETLSEVSESLLKDARAHAKDVALENTYKKANRVVSFLEGLRQKGYRKGSSLPNKVVTMGLDAELPYLKVPANLVINNFKYSPLGVFKSGVDASIAIAKGDTDALNVATRELSKGLTGTGMFLLGYMMFCEDQTDDNSWGFIGNAKDELKEYGVRDNSFKIGNHNFSLANMGIGSVQYLMGASLAEDFQEAGQVPAYQAIIDAAGKTLDVTADMSLLENATALMDAFGNGGDYDMTLSDRFGNAGQKIVGDYAAQFIANPLRGVAKGITDADLDTGVKKGDTTKVQRNIERGVNNFVQGIPVINENLLAHKVDTHGNLINERKTTGDKLRQVATNILDPTSHRKIHIPEADKEELKVLKINRETGEETDEKYKPKAFDEDRKFKAKIGKGEFKQEIDLTRKEREQAARSFKQSGKDMATALVYARRGWFGDSHGERAQQILAEIPEDEEKAREYLYSTPEFQSLSNKEKNDFLDTLYKGGTNTNTGGRNRTANKEVYVNIKGGDEGDFKFLNDLHSKTQAKYADLGLEEKGISKGQWADAIEAIKWENHKYKEETGENQDSYYSAKKVKNALLGMEGLDAEQRKAIYDAIRGKRTTFGWYDWDGVSGGSGYRRRRGYRRRGYRRRGGGGGSSNASKYATAKVNPNDFKAKNTKLSTVISTTDNGKVAVPKAKKTSTKVKPPTTKLKKYEV